MSNQLPPNIKDVPSMTRNPLADAFLTYQLMKRINTPFDKWDAYKLGIIDKNGKVLKKKSRLKTNNEKAAWGYFDIICANIKKILSKAPGGQFQSGSIAGSYLLMREQVETQNDVSEQDIEQMCEDVFGMASMNSGDASGAGVTPGNNIGQGNVKLFDPLLPKIKKVLRRKKPDVVS